MPSFSIKQGDTLPRLHATLMSGGGAADLTQNGGVSSIRFVMAQVGATTPRVDGAATVLDAATGVVEYAFTEVDTASSGDFRGEFKVEYVNGQKQTFPNDGYIDVQVKSKVAT